MLSTKKAASKDSLPIYTFPSAYNTSSAKLEASRIALAKLPTSSSSTSSTSSFSGGARVQLVPHTRNPSFETSFSWEEEEILRETKFDERDVSAQDFDFDDMFTYDKPQGKLSKVFEVSLPQRKSSEFSFSHYGRIALVREKSNKGIAGLYVKNQRDARKGGR